jgi:hypothetical protein
MAVMTQNQREVLCGIMYRLETTRELIDNPDELYDRDILVMMATQLDEAIGDARWLLDHEENRAKVRARKAQDTRMRNARQKRVAQ